MVSLPAALYDAGRQAGIELGPSFQWIGDTWKGEKEALCELRTPNGIDDLHTYRLHPGLIDSCFQLLAAILLDDDSPPEIYVPVRVGGIEVLGPVPGGRWLCHAALSADRRETHKTIEGSLTLCDAQGALFAKINNVAFKKADSKALLHDSYRGLKRWLYQIDWLRKDRGLAAGDEPPPQPGSPRRWLVFGDGTGCGESLTRHATNHGEGCVMVLRGDGYRIDEKGRYHIDPADENNFRRLFEDVARPGEAPLSGILYLWGLDFPDFEQMDASHIEASSKSLCSSLLHTVKALVRTGMEHMPRLWLVTRGVLPIGDRPLPSSVRQSVLWGLGRVIAMEHSDVWGSMIDLDREASVQETVLLWDEFTDPEGETQLALREGRRFVARFTRSRVELPERIQTRTHANMTCLITGGLGGLGMEVAGKMVEKGFTHLLLAGRSAPSASADRALRKLQQAGAHVVTMRADVSKEEDVRRILEQIEETMPPLRGIIHCAGVIDDGVLIQQEWRRFEKVLDPKVMGAWHLHEMTKALELDFFVMFSSISSLFGSVGQGNYAAANAFLDALAHHRRSKGLPAVSINWGAWASVGMAAVAADKIDHRLKDRGVSSIHPKEGLHILEHLLEYPVPQVSVLPIDWSRFVRSFGHGTVPLFFKELDRASQHRSPAAVPDRVPKYDLLKQIENATEHKRLQLIHDFVRRQVAHLLRVDADRSIDSKRPLQEMGFDSLMGVELRTILASALGLSLPVALFYDYPNIAEIADYLNKKIAPASSRGGLQEADAAIVDRRAEIPDLDQLTEAELADLLAAKLRD